MQVARSGLIKWGVACKPEDFMEGRETWWKDSDGIDPAKAGCHIGTDMKVERPPLHGHPAGRGRPGQDQGAGEFTLAKELGSFANLAVIMVTGKSDPRDKVLGLELGADDYVTKPYPVVEAGSWTYFRDIRQRHAAAPRWSGVSGGPSGPS